MSKETAYLITNMMEDVVQKGTGQAAKALGRPIAGKTGTTNEFINAWFIGGTPNLVAGTFVGFDDRRSLGETESGAHAALAHLDQLHEGSAEDRCPSCRLPFPRGLRSSKSTLPPAS